MYRILRHRHCRNYDDIRRRDVQLSEKPTQFIWTCATHNLVTSLAYSRQILHAVETEFVFVSIRPSKIHPGITTLRLLLRKSIGNCAETCPVVLYLAVIFTMSSSRIKSQITRYADTTELITVVQVRFQSDTIADSSLQADDAVLVTWPSVARL